MSTPDCKSVSGTAGHEECTDAALRSVIAAAIRKSKGKSRAQIAEELGKRVGRNLTLRMLDDYTAKSKPSARFPAAWIEDFCDATGDDELRTFFLSVHQKHLLKIGEQAEQLVSAASRKRKHK